MLDDDHDRVDPESATAPPPFDSMANLRALGDIQRRGLEAANLVVSRVISQVERSGPIFGAEPPPRSAGNDSAAPGHAATDHTNSDHTDSDHSATSGDFSDLVGQYTALTSSLLGAVLGGQLIPGAPADARAPTTPSNGSSVTAVPSPSEGFDGAAATLTLTPTTPGGRSEGELWLHNRSGAATTDVRLHIGDLRRHDGCAIAAAAVRFEPDHLPELPDLTSRGIRVSADVPTDAPPGTFRGIVLAANLPDLWLVVELDVLRAEDPEQVHVS